MKVIIAGSRTITDRKMVDDAMAMFERFQCTPTEVVCGGARGVDELGKAWAEERGIPVKMFPADWDAHGKAAGPIRNREMAGYAHALVAVWDGESRGTRNMIDEMRRLGKIKYTYPTPWAMHQAAAGGG